MTTEAERINIQTRNLAGQMLKNKDARKLNQQEQFKLRKRIVQLREEGMSNKEVSKTVGIYHTHVSTIWNQYKTGGIGSLQSKKRGRKDGEIRRLSSLQENLILEAMFKHAPVDFNMGLFLWTRKATNELISNLFRISIPLRTVSDYFARWQLIPEKPVKRISNVTNKNYKRWLTVHYKTIISRSRKEDFEIVWVDVCKVNKNEDICNICELDNVTMLSAVSNEGQIRLMFTTHELSNSVFLEFLTNLMHDVGKKIFVIIYNRNICNNEYVNTWLNINRNIEIEWLDSCYKY